MSRRSSRKVEVALDAQDELGEGPVWRASTGELLRVDIARGLVHGWSPRTGAVRTRAYDGETSAVVPCRDGGLLVAVGHELLLSADLGESEGGGERSDRAWEQSDGAWERLEGAGERSEWARERLEGAGEQSERAWEQHAGACERVACVEADRAENRFNDCRCDPQGRLWAGTMSKTRVRGTAGLYRLARGGEIELAIADTTLSNGIGWSPDGRLMYFIDSVAQRVDVLDFAGDDGSIANRRVFVEVDPEDGMPDGLTVDAEGGVWVCLFGGGALRRYDSEGALSEHVPLPVPHPTCPAFGGEDLSTLFVTTTRHRLSAAQRRELPHAGCVLAIAEPGVRGMAGSEFG